MKVVQIADAHAEQNKHIVESLEKLLSRAKAGELLSMVILYDGTGESEFGYVEYGDWDPIRAVYLAESWKASALGIGSGSDG